MCKRTKQNNVQKNNFYSLEFLHFKTKRILLSGISTKNINKFPTFEAKENSILTTFFKPSLIELGCHPCSKPKLALLMNEDIIVIVTDLG